MKIVQEFDEPVLFDHLEIKSAVYTQGYEIELLFSNEERRLIDFETFLSNSLHPSISKYLNKELFRQFKIVDGNLNWNDYDLIFPIDNLYTGKIN